MKNDLIKPGLLVAAHRDPSLITDPSACAGKGWTTILWKWHVAADGSRIIECCLKMKSSNQTVMSECHNTKYFPGIFSKEAAKNNLSSGKV